MPSLIASLGSIVQQLLQALMDAAPQMLNAASQLIGQMATAFSENWPSILQSIVSVLGKLVLTVLQNAPKLLAAGLKLVVAIGQGLTKGVGTILSAAGGLLKSLLNKILSGGKSLLSAGGKLIGNLASGVRNAATNVWNAAKAVAEKLLSPITAVKEKIKGIIDKIKGFFKFKVTMPHIPVPHFGINPSGWKVKDLLHGSIPSLSVKWYAKGGVFDGPSVVGVGEAGPEAVVPLKGLWARFDAMADSIVNGVGMQLAVANSGGSGGDIHLDVYLYPNGPKMREEIVKAYDTGKKRLG